ncbi:MAG TPA: restriction endonuclease [Pyrinomonadaceae bacterium]
MAIWEYKDDTPEPTKDAVRSEQCIFCESPMHKILENEERPFFQGGKCWETTFVKTCPVCGWWNLCVDEVAAWNLKRYENIYGAHAHLKNFDLSDSSQPVEEVRSYLLAKYNERFTMHPRLFEETVASVFRDLGFSARVTAYQNDGGIDVVLDGPDDKLIGIQVKRYKNRIEVEHVRALTGALFIGGFTKGIFVTTPSFQSGASKAAKISTTRGLPIELIDAHKFFDALKITKRAGYTSYEDWKEAVGDIERRLIEHWMS